MTLSIASVADAILSFVESAGYIGIFIMTVIEGTLIPIPSEITLIPAGALCAEGKMNIYLVLSISIVGNFLGSQISYFLGLYFGEKLVTRYGKYILFTRKKFNAARAFFDKYGPMSVFFGRILPGFKHFISFPAGMLSMNLKLFSVYSFLGGAVWVAALTLSGYFFADKLSLLRAHIEYVNSVILILILFVASIFLYRKYIKRSR